MRCPKPPHEAHQLHAGGGLAIMRPSCWRSNDTMPVRSGWFSSSDEKVLETSQSILACG